VKIEDSAAKAKIIELPNSQGETVRVGVIDLPSFYAPIDFSARKTEGGNNETTGRSTTEDVARLLRKLKTENVRGVVLDLRRNGGGSLEEAVKLTGLFIKDGPVVQVKDWRGVIEEDSDRDQVLRLARQLAETRERQNVEAQLQVEDLKRALRERAADIARRELEVERRTRELDELDARGHDGRRRRMRRSERPQEADGAYADELLTRREAEVQQRLDALVPRERAVAERETALRARELDVEEAEAAVLTREQEAAESSASAARRKVELESSYARLREGEAALAQRQAALEEQERLLEVSRSEVSQRTDELVARAATLKAAEQVLEVERTRLAAEERELERRSDAPLDAQDRGAREWERRLAARARELEERARAVAEQELQLADREREAAAAEHRSAAEGERMLEQLESQLAAGEAALLAREADLLRLQSGLATQQESIRRRERALEDAERMRERETVLPAVPYVSFSEGLDAFSGGRQRSN